MLSVRPFLLSPLLLTLSACSGEVETQPTTTTDPSKECSVGTADEGLPPPPDGPAAPDGGPRFFAVSHWYLGGAGPDGVESTHAWEEYGFNLDRTVTTRENLCTCTPVAGAKPAAIADGPLGRDNDFGRWLLPMLYSANTELEKDVGAQALAGRRSWLVELDGVGAQPAYSGLTGQIFEAAPLLGPDGMPVAPAFDGTDVWPIADDSLAGTDPPAAKLQIHDAYLVAGDQGESLWVGRGKGTLRLYMTGAGLEMPVVIHDPVLVLPLSANRTAIQRGMLGGTLDVAEIEPEVVRLAGSINPANCQGSSPSVDAILQQVRQAQDMVGAGVELNALCDRISIGIAFDAAPAQLGEVAPPAPILDPCAPP